MIQKMVFLHFSMTTTTPAWAAVWTNLCLTSKSSSFFWTTSTNRLSNSSNNSSWCNSCSFSNSNKGRRRLRVSSVAGRASETDMEENWRDQLRINSYLFKLNIFLLIPFFLLQLICLKILLLKWKKKKFGTNPVVQMSQSWNVKKQNVKNQK